MPTHRTNSKARAVFRQEKVKANPPLHVTLCLHARHSTQPPRRKLKKARGSLRSLHSTPCNPFALPPLCFCSCNAPVNAEVRIFKDKARPAPFAIFAGVNASYILCFKKKRRNFRCISLHFAACVGKERYYSTSIRKQKHPPSCQRFLIGVPHCRSDRGESVNGSAAFLVLVGDARGQLKLLILVG